MEIQAIELKGFTGRTQSVAYDRTKGQAKYQPFLEKLYLCYSELLYIQNNDAPFRVGNHIEYKEMQNITDLLFSDQHHKQEFLNIDAWRLYYKYEGIDLTHKDTRLSRLELLENEVCKLFLSNCNNSQYNRVAHYIVKQFDNLLFHINT